MKNDFLWAKTLLSIYRYLERVSGAIDKIMLKKALASGRFSIFASNSCESIADELIDLMERKVTLVNLKVLVEESLSSIRQRDAQILVDKFIGGVKTRELVEKHNSSMRNIFRRLDCALSSFEKQLLIRGYDEQKLTKMLGTEEWIMVVKSRFENHEEEVTLSKLALAHAVR